MAVPQAAGDLLACPSVVLTIAPGADGLNAQLRDLLSLSDPVVRQAIDVLAITAQGDGVLVGQRMADEEPLPLADAIEHAIARVQGQRVFDALHEAGFRVTDGAIFYIVLDHADPVARALGGRVLAAIRAVTEQRFRVRRQVAYVLLNLPKGGKVPPRDIFPTLTPAEVLDRVSADYVFIFDPVSNNLQQSIATPDQVVYDAAEALFALVATGLPEAEVVDRALRALREHTAPQTFSPFIGTLVTTFIRFPLQAAIDYSSAELGGAVARGWAPRMGDVTNERQRAMREDGVAEFARFHDWLDDTDARPGAFGVGIVNPSGSQTKLTGAGLPIPRHSPQNLIRHRWPTLRLAPQGTVDEIGIPLANDEWLARLNGQSKELFSVMAPQNMLATWDDARSLEMTCMRIERHAAERLQEWTETATTAWQEVGRHVQARVQQRSVHIWQTAPETGANDALFYLYGSQEALRQIEVSMPAQQAHHAEVYGAIIATLEKRSVGPWRLSEHAPVIRHDTLAPDWPPQAEPRARSEGNDESLLPPRERQLAQGLRLRAAWYRARVPSVLGVIAQAALSFPTLSFLVLTLLPIQWSHSAGGVIATLIGVACVVMLGMWWMFVRRRAAFHRALDDLASLYLAFYAYQCERHEDHLRETTILSPLKDLTQRMRQWLEGLEPFFDDIAQSFSDQSERVYQQFMESPASSRDVFIANGEPLQQFGPHDLRAVHAVIDAQRTRQSPSQLDPSQRGFLDILTIRERVFQEWRQRHADLFRLSQDEARAAIHHVTTAVVTDYLTNPDTALINVSRALTNPAVWSAAQARLELARYHHDALHPQTFHLLCGRDQDRRLLATDGFDELATNRRDWVLAGRLVQGGDPQWLDSDQLFPPLEALDRTSEQ